MNPSSPVEIGTRRELFVDRCLIDRFEGSATLKLHPPQRREVVFQVEPPLENACSAIYSVLVEDDNQFLLYYRGYYPLHEGSGDTAREQTSHLAVSEDGIHFERPELGIYDFDDGGRNNVVWQGIQAHNLVPFVDRNPVAAPQRRFKAVGGTGENNLYALHSPDGVHWSLTRDEPLSVPGKFDSANVAFWHKKLGKYRLFSRFVETRHGCRFRAIQSCESDDFLHWSDPVPHVYADDAPAEHFYTNATVPCPGAEHLLLSFPMRFVPHREPPVETGLMKYPGNPGNRGMSDAVMMSSRDGRHWNRPFPEAWLRAGPDARNWTHRNQTPAVGIVANRHDQWSMYAAEHYGWPDNRLRRLAVRPWGFASINAGRVGGDVITRPLIFSGNELRLNYATSAPGSVRVEVQDVSGRALAGLALDDMEPVYGDKLDATVRWKDNASLQLLNRRPVRLRFVLCDADVFSFRFANDVAPA